MTTAWSKEASSAEFWALGSALGLLLPIISAKVFFNDEVCFIGLFLFAFVVGMGTSGIGVRVKCGIALLLGTFVSLPYYFSILSRPASPSNLAPLVTIFFVVVLVLPFNALLAYLGMFFGVLTKWVITRLAKNKIPYGTLSTRLFLYSALAVVMLVVAAMGVYPIGHEVAERKAHRQFEREKVAKAKEALKVAEQTFGPDHPNVASSLNNLAEVYRAQESYADAEPLLKRALELREKALGPDHPAVAESLDNLVWLYIVQENYKKAEPLQKRALAILEKVKGPDHPAVAESLDNLAWLYSIQENYKKVEPLQKRALAILEKVKGPDHPDVADSLKKLAEFYNAGLRRAAKEGRTEEVKAWIARGADVNAVVEIGFTALIYAAKGGHTEAVKALLEAGADVQQSKRGWTALMWAASRSRTETVKALLEAGADVNPQRKSGMTALILAAKGGHTETVKALLDAGADVNAKNLPYHSHGRSRTALILAAKGGHIETVKALLDAGADVNAKDMGGQTVLMWTEKHGRIEIVQLLKQAGAKE
jgi:tetratricopeptide (TPR) repeat protein